MAAKKKARRRTPEEEARRQEEKVIINPNTRWLLEELERSERGLPPRKRPKRGRR